MKIQSIIPVLLLSLSLVIGRVATAQAQSESVLPRLEVSSNGRYLQYRDQAPFFYLGDTAWSLIHRLNREEVDRYLNDRARKGFTVIQTVALAELNGLIEPNAYGELPLIDLDPSKPNQNYFKHADYVVDRAEALGMFVGLLPTWGKYWKTGDANKVFTVDNAYSYGQFLGQRYKDKPIIWILGGDQNVVTKEERGIIDAMAAGLRDGDDGNHLITFHPRGPGQSSAQLHDAKWLDFHMSQTSHAGRNLDTGLYAERDLALKPLRPTLDGEPRYEGIPVGFYLKDHNRLERFDDDDVRQAAWWSVMAGACGHTYGNNNIWQMWQAGREPAIGANIPWWEALDHPGAMQLGFMRRFMEANRFHTLLPDQSLVVDGPLRGPAKIRAMRSVDRSRIIVYSPMGEAFTLDQSQLNAVRSKKYWFDPRYGVSYEFRVSPRDRDNQTYQIFTPPTAGRGQDWVLVFEATAVQN
ncbi:glycoside hydrolase family 140 protein [Arenicella xantha]|uniref:Collagenase-like protein with putative collagen-binding domain n=1 Tax=Arenicella xantha TaxID=644221 RepID=A0A395JNR3_9GAMM|nr:glycoside hydrolase family 140 protein [Arenicella xantha]RBP51228.1 collagenase-like protein with putative collagen-binding domain [Arenicella xantha]